MLTDGADDYITKPFYTKELLSRISANLRRSKFNAGNIYKKGDIVVDFDRYKISRQGDELNISTNEFDIVKMLIENKGRVVRREFRDMVLTRSTFEVSIGGRVLPKITKQEFAILELLLKNPKQVFSKEDIFEYAWDEPYMGETKTLDVHISNIRKKIKTVTPDEYIETIWGIGYRLHE